MVEDNKKDNDAEEKNVDQQTRNNQHNDSSVDAKDTSNKNTESPNAGNEQKEEKNDSDANQNQAQDNQNETGNQNVELSNKSGDSEEKNVDQQSQNNQQAAENQNVESPNAGNEQKEENNDSDANKNQAQDNQNETGNQNVELSNKSGDSEEKNVDQQSQNNQKAAESQHDESPNESNDKKEGKIKTGSQDSGNLQNDADQNSVQKEPKGTESSPETTQANNAQTTTSKASADQKEKAQNDKQEKAPEKTIDKDQQEIDSSVDEEKEHNDGSKKGESKQEDGDSKKDKKETSSGSINEKHNEEKDAEYGEKPQIYVNDVSRWFIKVLSGPNIGAQFFLNKGKAYVLGSDLFGSDINIMDLSVSSRHARISVEQDDKTLFIEDLHSKNGVYVNGKKISGKTAISNNDFIKMGVSSFIIVDSSVQETTVDITGEESEVFKSEGTDSKNANNSAEVLSEYMEAKTKKIKEMSKFDHFLNWSKRNLSNILGPLLIMLVSSTILIGVCIMLYFTFTDYRTINPGTNYPERKVGNVLVGFSGVKFIYTKETGSLLMSGHIITRKDHDELMYRLAALPFISTLIDRMVIDEDIVNEIIRSIYSNKKWHSIRATVGLPGVITFVGSLKNTQDVQEFLDYVYHVLDIHNFVNEIIVEERLMKNINNIIDNSSVAGRLHAEFENDFLVIYGDVDEEYFAEVNNLITEIANKEHVVVENLVVFASKKGSGIRDISNNYDITGYIIQKNKGGIGIIFRDAIYQRGDEIAGMTIEQIGKEYVVLRNGNRLFKARYNNS